MDRYTISFLILAGWFVVFKMFPAKLDFRDMDQEAAMYGTVGTQATGSYEESLMTESQRRGKIAFEANCARCHSSRLEKHSTGPGLLYAGSRIPPGDWIYKWVRNSSKLIQEGDAYAVKIWNESNKASMDPFPNLSNETIDDIMAWINGYGLQ